MREANTLRVAVLGDVHGHLSLAYTLLRRWERETAHTLDAILQVGDLGAYPPPYRLDKPTKRFAERDPDELGFTAYHAGDDEAAAILGPDAEPHRYIAADTFFIRGNHEDFVYLDEIARGAKGPVAVDPFERIHYLPNGQRYELTRRGATLRVAALGGISHQGGAGHAPEHYTTHDVRTLGKTDATLDRWAFMAACRSNGKETTSIVGEGPCDQAYTPKSSLGSAVAVAPSFQTGHGSLPLGAAGKLRGLTFQRQWATALSVMPDYVFVSGWNELVAQPQMNPFKTDPFAKSVGLERDPR